MKKIFTFAVAALMAVSASAVTETVSSIDLLNWAVENLEEGSTGRKNLTNDQFTAGNKFAGTQFYTLNEAETLPTLAFQLWPNKDWTLARSYSASDVQMGLRASRNSDTKNMIAFPALKKDMKVILVSQAVPTLVSEAASTDVQSADETLNFTYGEKAREAAAKKSTYTMLADGDLVLSFETGNVIHSVLVTKEVDDSEYEWKTLAAYANGEVTDGTVTVEGTAVLDYAAKYNKNATSCKVITFPNSYSSTKDGVTTYCYAEVSIEGGFKAGDVLTIQPFTAMSASDIAAGEKFANIEIRTIAGEEVADAVNLTGSAGGALTVTDGHEEEGDPKTFEYVLPADCDAFRLARQGKTRINLLSLSVARRTPKTPETPTAIENTTNVAKTGIMYNILGQQVDENYKGVVIIDGKKFLRQ